MNGGMKVSFSSQVKDEICRHEITSKCCMLAEMTGILMIEGAIDIDVVKMWALR